MKKIMMLTVFVLFFMSYSAVPLLYADDHLTWLEVDAPPFYIFEGPLAGQGYQTVVTDLLEDALPQYQHQHAIANMSRHYELFRSGAQVCALALFKNPEREKMAYFSIPSVCSLPGVLVISKKSYEAFGGTAMVNLSQLLRDNKLIFGLSKKRSFGSCVDDVFTKYGTDKNVFAYEGDELSRNFFEMLGRGRVDAFVGMPEEIAYQAERLGLQDTIMTLAIEENSKNNMGTITYVACSKTPWGKQAIEDINTALLTLRPTEAYRRAYERWIGKESVDMYRTFYQTGFLDVVK